MNFRPTKPRLYGTEEAVVADLIGDAGGAKQAAHAIGRSPTQVYAYSDPDAPDRIVYGDVRRLVELSGSLAPAEDLAALAGGYVTAVEASDASLEALLAQGEREHGEAMARLIGLFGDHSAGRLPAPERAELTRRLDDMIRAFVAARRKLGPGRDGPA